MGADVVAAILLEPTDRIGAVYELTGPESLDMDGLAAQFALALGRPVVAENESVVLPDHVRHHIETMARLHREDRYNLATDDVERIIGRPAHSVAQYVAAHRDLFD